MTAESAENISAIGNEIKTNINDVPPISSPVASRESLRMSTHRASNILRKTEYRSAMSKNNLRRITLVRLRTSMGIHSLTLTISCREIFLDRGQKNRKRNRSNQTDD